MSLERLESVVAGLPANFRDPVIGYANSVRLALPNIMRQAELRRDRTLEDEVVFIAGIKKVYAIVSSTFETLRKALAYLEQNDISMVHVAGREYSFNSSEYKRLRKIYQSLHTLVVEENVARFMDDSDYVHIVRILADERRQA